MRRFSSHEKVSIYKVRNQIALNSLSQTLLRSFSCKQNCLWIYLQHSMMSKEKPCKLTYQNLNLNFLQCWDEEEVYRNDVIVGKIFFHLYIRFVFTLSIHFFLSALGKCLVITIYFSNWDMGQSIQEWTK